jgi:hypothetical protein
MDLFIYLIIIVIVCCVQIRRASEPQIGGGRSAIFSRFYYEPQFPFMSKLDDKDLDVFSKIYNTAGPLKLIMGRPYRYYTMPEGNWGYPWHFPEPVDSKCLSVASDRCEENIGFVPIKTEAEKLGGLFYQTPKDVIRPSKCFDSVYRQCRAGVDPLLIHVADKGVYDYGDISEQS